MAITVIWHRDSVHIYNVYIHVLSSLNTVPSVVYVIDVTY